MERLMTTMTTTPAGDPTAALEIAEPRTWRSYVPGAAMVIIGLYGLWAFGHGRTGHGVKAKFTFNWQGGGGIKLPSLTVPAATTAIVLGALCVLLGVSRLVRPRMSRGLRILTTTAFLVLYLAAFLVWSDAHQTLNLVGMLDATVLAAVPLILGSLGGVLCERSGVINVAIEGQFLVGACAAAFTASTTGSLWLGLVMGCLAGALIGALLAVFANRYRVEQVVLGVVINLFATGLTGFIYDRLLAAGNGNNQPMSFSNIRIPGLADLPLIGHVLFEKNILVYATAVLVAVVQFALFRTKWGLRTRAVGEHPTAADTVGINVNRTRYINVILGGVLAGLGGVWLTIGSNISFNQNMSAGQGFIALAALIFGRWSPVGAMFAALLFGFAQGLSTTIQPLQTPVPTEFLTMLPYLATVFAVAGLVGAVRAPAADGQPYVKE
jgi:simple sugar transport system permease protein